MATFNDLKNALWLKERMKLIRDNSIYGLPMLEVDDKTYEYCRHDALDTYRYLAEYMAVKPVTATEIEIAKDMLENSRRNNNMTKSDEVYLVQWKKNEGKDSVNSGNIKVLGKIINGYMNFDYDDPVTVVGNDPKNVLTLKGPTRAISANIDISDSVFDTGDFAMILQKLAHYAELGIDATKTKAKGLVIWNTANKFEIKKVIFSGPCTIVFWADGTKTMVRVQGDDKLDREKGLAMAIAKRAYGDKGNYSNIFKRWLLGENWRKLERAAAKIAKLAKVDKASDEDLKKAIDKSKKIIEKSKKKSTKKR